MPLTFEFLLSVDQTRVLLKTKAISKAIVDRTRLRNRFLGTRSNGNKEAYNKQQNYFVYLIR